MASSTTKEGRRVERLHPLLHKALAGIVIWSLIAAWAVWYGSAGTDIAAAVLLLIVLAVIAAIPPYNLWRIWFARDLQRLGLRVGVWPRPGTWPFRDWWNGELGIYQGRLRGGEAALLLFLPLTIVPVLLTLFAVIKLFDFGGIA